MARRQTAQELVREAREAKGLSQAAVAKLAKIGGSLYAKWEQGNRGLNPSARLRIARALGLEASAILTRDERKLVAEVDARADTAA